MNATVSFLTPLGVALALGGLIPLVALVVIRRRASRVRRTVGLPYVPPRRLVPPLVALAFVSVLVGLAAAQPILERTSERRVRTDAQAFFVLDVSRSMLARSGAAAPARIERAKNAATRIRSELSEVPFGIATFTDRTLPHLFPSPNLDVFQATLDRSIGIERPPPNSSILTNVTKLDSLAAIRTQRYFTPTAKKRLLIVLTDGESLPVAGARLGKVLRRQPAIDSIFVHFWRDGERVYSRGAPEPEYRPDPSSGTLLRNVASSTQGEYHSERAISAAIADARRMLGDGPTEVRGQSRGRQALAPYLALVAFLPLGLLLWRRDR